MGLHAKKIYVTFIVQTRKHCKIFIPYLFMVQVRWFGKKKTSKI